MSTTTPNLGMPYLEPSQSQPEITVNECLDILDAAVGTPGVTVTEDGANSPGDTILAKTIKFAGATVTPESNDVALVTINAAPGGVQAITVNATYLTESGTTTVALDLSTGIKATIASALQTVSVTNSITGNGAGTALKLSGDSASPGNNFFYGTDASGTKGWHATPLTTKGDLQGFDTAPARVGVGVDGQVLTANSANAKGVAWATPVTGLIGAIPGTIPDCVMWYESDDILATAGTQVQRLRERTPYLSGLCGTWSGTGPANAVSSVTINGLPTLKFLSTGGGFTIPSGLSLTGGATIFAVINPVSAGTGQAILGGPANALALYLCGTAGTAKCSLTKTSVAIIGNSTTTWVANTPFQVNATYVTATGAYAFRQGRASAGSGTGTTGAGVSVLSSIIGADSNVTTVPLINASLAALIVYNRVLTSPEITAVENYLLAKWGV